MESIKEIFKIGYGPSSSHTMGPSYAAIKFKNENPDADSFKVTLYGSLALTGKGHLTDKILKKSFEPYDVEIIFDFKNVYEYHSNGLLFESFKDSKKLKEWLVFSVGGGSLKEKDEKRNEFKEQVYPHHLMNDILEYCSLNNISLCEYVDRFEGNDLNIYLTDALYQMKKTLQIGLEKDGLLPGRLNVKRKAKEFYQKFLANQNFESLVYSYALATSEENASGNIVVTAPTCGSSGVVPAVLLSYQKYYGISDERIIDALKVAGLVGNLVKTNASISGAEVGCQGEVGVACSMASAGLMLLEKGNNLDIEYASEIALEHHLGMTCDPVDGMVQIPCIERNAVAAMQACNVVNYVKLSGNSHYITLDSIIQVMNETGKDLHSKYKETSTGGLALHERG